MLQMKLQLLPSSLLPMHTRNVKHGVGELGMPWLVCHAGMLWDIQVGGSEASTFGLPNSLWGSYSSRSPAAFTLLFHQPPPDLSSHPFPTALCRAFPGSCSQMPRAPFSWAAAEGNSAQALHRGTWQSKGGTLEHCLDII